MESPGNIVYILMKTWQRYQIFIELARWVIVFRIVRECWGCGLAQFMPSMFEALVLMPSTANKQTQEDPMLSENFVISMSRLGKQ